MTGTFLWQVSACDLAERVAAGELSATAAVGASIDRMREMNPALNAVVDDCSAEALEEAARLDRQFERSGVVGPLHGVPVTIKENVDQEGWATTNGVEAFKDIIAPADAPVVANLKKAGAVVIGRTNTPEFSFRATTVNELHGRTFNPWNDWASAGGSSGGASAAVMAGMGALAHGNDIGGSLRYPSAATGAATVKPGLGRVPAYNPSATVERGMLAQLMSVQGVIAREIRDVRLSMRSMIAPDPHDPWHVPMPFDGPPTDRPIRVAFTRNSHGHEMDAAVDLALSNARDALVDAGYVVEEVEPPNVAEIAAEATSCLFGEIEVLLLDDIRKYGSSTINAVFDAYFEMYGAYTGTDLVRGMAKRAHFARAWLLFLQRYPLVLTPFRFTTTYAWDADEHGVAGLRSVLGNDVYAMSMNFMGLPAGNIPANFNDGLPVGVQIVGQRFREDMILDACEAIESRIGVMAKKLFERGLPEA